MKTPALFFLITLFQTTLCYSQNLLTEDKLWSNVIFGSENPDIYKTSYWIKFQGDTTINNFQYKKVLQADDPLHSNWYVNGFIREDTTNQKVYLFNNYSKTDQLLYDFSLVKGDSILVRDSVVFAKVDTVIYEPFGNSKDTVKQICFNKFYTHRWIKGIGSSRGILNGLQSFYTTGAYYYLLCYYENETMVYSNSKFNDCFLTTATRELPVSSALIRAFQSTKGKLTVELNKAKSGTIYLYNTMGQLYKTEIITERLNTISLPGNGIFIYRFKSENGEIKSGKIIIR